MAYCTDQNCQIHIRKGPLGRAHSLLSKKIDLYHKWHHYEHHQRVHWGAATLHLLLVFSLLMSAIGVGAPHTLASTATWDLGTASDYTYDSSKVEFTGGVAQLKGAYTPGTDWIASDGSTNWGFRKALTIDNTGNASTLTNYSVKLDEGLLAHYKMDESSGTTVADSSGYGVNATASGAAVTTSGQFSNARTFSSSTDAIDGISGRMQEATNTFSVSLWVKPSATRTSTTESNSGVEGLSNQRYAIRPDHGTYYDSSSAGSGLSVGTNGISVVEYAGSYVPTPLVYNATISGWNHVVIVYTSGTPKLYLNGTLVRTGVASGKTYVHPSVVFGDSTGTNPYAGDLDEVRYYNRALSTTEISSLYSSNTSGYFGTAYSNLQSAGQDLRFTDSDGKTVLSHYIEKVNTSGENLTAWVKIPSITGSSTKTIYMYYGNSSASTTSSGGNTFQFYDDFSTANLDATKWNTVNSSGSIQITQSGNRLTMLETSATPDFWNTADTATYIYPTTSFSGNYVAETNIHTTTYNQNGRFIGARATSATNAPEYAALTDSANNNITTMWRDTAGGTPDWPGDGTGIGKPPATALPWKARVYKTGSAISIYAGSTLVGTRSLGGLAVPFLGDTSIGATAYGNTYSEFFVRQWSTPEPGLASSSGIAAASGLFPTDNPTVTLNTAQTYISASGFAETAGSGSSGNIKYQISPNGGTTWYWYNGSAWATTSGGYTESNPASTVNTNISTFTAGTTPKTFKWRAYLNSDASQLPKIDSLTLTYINDSVAPPNPSTVTATSSNGGSALTTNTWYNHAAPYFTWSEPTDTAAGGESASGIAGYYVYFGTSSSADPYTAGSFQAGRTYTAGSLTSGQTYYFIIKTKDNADNVTASGTTLFIYKYDGTAPTAPAFVSVSPSGFTNTNSYTFVIPTTGGNAATDAHSGLAGYQYKTGASSGTFSDWSSTTTATEITLASVAYQDGANFFQLRAIDTAGNVSSTVQVVYYYGGSAPSAPQNVTVAPSTSAGSPATENSFSFSWTAPATYNGSIKEYHYSVNALPTENNSTTTTSTSVAASSFATQQGKNTFYVVAEDEAGNVNYDVYASVDFYAQTAAPGAPTTFEAFDTSNRDTKNYRAALSWVEPSSKGTGFAGYEIFRSTDNSSFSSVGTTTGTTFSDTGLQSRLYYYYVKSKDNAGQYSSASTTVSITPTGKYTTAPELTETTKVTAKAFSATISWETDRVSSSFIEYGTDKQKIGISSGGKTQGQLEQTKKHEVVLNGLEPETIYYYQAVWVDSDGNTGRTDTLTFKTGDRPKISDVKITSIGLEAATISWTSTTIASSTVVYGKTTAYGGIVTDRTEAAKSTAHTVQLTDLDDSTTYHFQITGTDTDNNTLASDDYSFSTLTRPKISNLRFEPVKDAANTTITVSWTTNVATTSNVVYTPNGGASLSKSDASLKTDHAVTISELADQSVYLIRAESVDQFGNKVVSDQNSYTTPEDTRPPKVSDLTVEVRSNGFGATQSAQVVVSFKTDEPANALIEYGAGIASSEYSGKTQKDNTLTTNHVIIVTGLEPAKLYHLRVTADDAAGNEGFSTDTTVITGKTQASVLDIIARTLERTLGPIANLSRLNFFGTRR